MLHFHINEFFIYPIKSIAPVSLEQLILTPQGLQYDRHWMIVQNNGKVVTQRDFPQLNRIKCYDEKDHFRLKLINNEFPDICFKKDSPLGIDKNITLWRNTFHAFTTQDQLSEWFSDFLGVKVFIVTQPERIKELADSESIKLNFQDSSPVHLVNIKSVDDLSLRCGYTIHPSQFRANIYIDMDRPYQEDAITEIVINERKFLFLKPCERCSMINIIPNDSTLLKEPLNTLSKYRKFQNKVCFGIYLTFGEFIS